MLLLPFKGASICHLDGSVIETLIFNTFVLCQVFDLLHSRNLEKWNVFEGIYKNMIFQAIVGMFFSLQVLILETKFAGTERLKWRQLAACVGMDAISWPIALVVRCIPNPLHNLYFDFIVKCIRNVTGGLQELCLILNSFVTITCLFLNSFVRYTTNEKELTHMA